MTFTYKKMCNLLVEKEISIARLVAGKVFYDQDFSKLWMYVEI